MKRFWVLGVVLGLAWAQSIQVEVKGELAQVETQALAALKANGLEPDRILNLGGQIRQITGAAFPDYHLVVLKPEAGSLAAASKNPMAAIVLPPTVYVHAAKAGVTTVGTFDGRLMFSLLGVAGPETDGLTSRLEASLGRLGQARAHRSGHDARSQVGDDAGLALLCKRGQGRGHGTAAGGGTHLSRPQPHPKY